MKGEIDVILRAQGRGKGVYIVLGQRGNFVNVLDFGGVLHLFLKLDNCQLLRFRV